MIKENKFTVIGSGRRVQQDVIPVLIELGFSPNNISIYSSREKKIYVRDTEYKVYSIENLNKTSINKFVYVSIPHQKLYELLKKIFDIDSSSKVIVDTPIVNSKIVEKFKKNIICVAEDAAFISNFLIKKNELFKYNILLLNKSAFSYHGIAFVESILSGIVFHFSLFGLYFAFCKKGIAVIIGKNNYEKGSIYLNFKKISFPNLNESEIELIGGLSDFDSVSYRFLDLKRLGLKILINNFLINSNKLISLEQGLFHFNKSKVINLYVNTLKNLIKKIIKKF